MHSYGWGFFGMHMFWWLFWLCMVAVFFVFLTPVPRGRARRRSLTPLEILQRRYASGEITTAEYEERKQVLERGDAQRRSGGPPAAQAPPSMPSTASDHP